MVRGDIADIKNAAGRWGGAITAALFLEEFVADKTPWVHMDIAGSAFADEPLPTSPKGGTGTSVGTLIRYLEQIAVGQEG